MIDTTYRRSSSLYCLQTTDRIGTGLRANPVCGELPGSSTVVTVIFAQRIIYWSHRKWYAVCLRLWREWWFRRGRLRTTSRLQGYVAGALISTNASNNLSYGKTAFISLVVPAGATYQITSIRPKTTLVIQGYFQYLDTRLNCMAQDAIQPVLCSYLYHFQNQMDSRLPGSNENPQHFPFWQWHKSQIAPSNQ